MAPGKYKRLTALRLAGADAVKIIYGAAFMLLIAAFIEAFWSSRLDIANAIKYSVGAILWLFVIGYCVYAGRKADIGS